MAVRIQPRTCGLLLSLCTVTEKGIKVFNVLNSIQMYTVLTFAAQKILSLDYRYSSDCSYETKTTLIIIKVLLIIPTLKKWGCESHRSFIKLFFKKGTGNEYVLKCYGDFNSFRKKGSLLMEIFKKKKEPR